MENLNQMLVIFECPTKLSLWKHGESESNVSNILPYQTLVMGASCITPLSLTKPTLWEFHVSANSHFRILASGKKFDPFGGILYLQLINFVLKSSSTLRFLLFQLLISII